MITFIFDDDSKRWKCLSIHCTLLKVWGILPCKQNLEEEYVYYSGFDLAKLIEFPPNDMKIYLES